MALGRDRPVEDLAQLLHHARTATARRHGRPAPAATGISPSALLSSIALRAKLPLMMSCSTTPAQPCTAALTSSRAPSEVITTGTRYLAQSSTSSSSRLFGLVDDLVDREQRRGPSPGCARVPRRPASSVISGEPFVQLRDRTRVQRRGTSRRCPPCTGRSPARGPETMNSGEPITGRRRRSRRTAGRVRSSGGSWSLADVPQ